MLLNASCTHASATSNTIMFNPVNLPYSMLSVRVFSSFAPITKARVTPCHTFPDWLECTGAYGNKHYFGDFQVLGAQPGSEILCNGETTAGRTEAQQVLSPFYTPFERSCHIHAIHSCQPGKAWLSVNHTFAVGTNELNALTESMYSHWHSYTSMQTGWIHWAIPFDIPLHSRLRFALGLSGK